MRRPRIALDLDKTLVQYNGWKGEDHIDILFPGAFEFVKTLSDSGWYIIIFTARAENANSINIISRWVKETFPFLVGRQLIQVTNIKLREIECFVDDRAITFRENYTEVLDDLKDYVQRKQDVWLALNERKQQCDAP